MPGHHLVDDCADAEDVGPVIHGLAANLLRRHVASSSQHRPRSGLGEWPGVPSDLVGGLCELREPEVEDLDAPLPRHEDVVRFQVAVDDAFVMRGGESLGDLACIVDGLATRGRGSAHPAPEGLALEQLRHHVRRTLVRAHVVDRQDIRMIQLTGRACLLLEAMQPARIHRERLGDQLDRHLAPEPWIPCAVDLAHAPGTQPSDDLVWTDVGTGRHCHGNAQDYRAGCASVSVDPRPARTWKVTSTDPMRMESPSVSWTGEVMRLLPRSSSSVPSAVTKRRA